MPAWKSILNVLIYAKDLTYVIEPGGALSTFCSCHDAHVNELCLWMAYTMTQAFVSAEGTSCKIT